MKIISYNLNGIRSAMTKGLVDFMQAQKADVYCFQEVKANSDQVQSFLFEVIGYPYQFWFSAEKKGYSGVAIFSKIMPDLITYGFNHPEWDNEGRIIRADFGSTSIISVYMPSGSSGDERQAYKMRWLSFFDAYIRELKKTRGELIICGDYNICHKPIDIHNPKSNAGTSGFLPEERDWMEDFIQSGFIDSFRHFNQEPHQYTWWSYRAGARGKNLGWRIDYNLVTKNLQKRLKRSVILPDAMHSDHCPVLLEIS